MSLHRRHISLGYNSELYIYNKKSELNIAYAEQKNKNTLNKCNKIIIIINTTYWMKMDEL